MKKFLAMLLSVIAVTCLFSACGSDNGDKENDPTVIVQQTSDEDKDDGENKQTNVVQPISDGGSYDGSNYS